MTNPATTWATTPPSEKADAALRRTRAQKLLNLCRRVWPRRPFYIDESGERVIWSHSGGKFYSADSEADAAEILLALWGSHLVAKSDDSRAALAQLLDLLQIQPPPAQP